jgi:hypothetical protein
MLPLLIEIQALNIENVDKKATAKTHIRFVIVPPYEYLAIIIAAIPNRTNISTTPKGKE